MSVKDYTQLKKNLKTFGTEYSGIMATTCDSARLAIIDLEEEVQSLKGQLEEAQFEGGEL